jgi:hypothetical protein
VIGSILAIALASQPTPKTPAMGIGSQSCAVWVSAADRGSNHPVDRQLMLVWAEGHASAVAALLGVDLLSRLNEPGLSYWIDNYCHAHPTQSLAAALVILEDNLASMISAQSSPPQPSK